MEKPLRANKKIFFSNGTLRRGMSYLQSVTPSDAEHPAHFWHDGTGRRILALQENFINILKTNLIKCKSKQHIQIILDHFGQPDWRSVDPRFWKRDKFAVEILADWQIMFEKFLNYINSLEG